jgi:hypothetical protein
LRRTRPENTSLVGPPARCKALSSIRPQIPLSGTSAFVAASVMRYSAVLCEGSRHVFEIGGSVRRIAHDVSERIVDVLIIDVIILTWKYVLVSYCQLTCSNTNSLQSSQYERFGTHPYRPRKGRCCELSCLVGEKSSIENAIVKRRGSATPHSVKELLRY